MTCRLVLRNFRPVLLILGLGQVALIQTGAVVASDKPAPEGESFFFIPPGFTKEGEPLTADGRETGTLHLVVTDADTGRPAPCRINVVGPDGNFYQPAENRLSLYSLTGEWPKPGAKGNRREKAPYRYLGRFFYSTGETTLTVPAGASRVEVWKGFEFQPQKLNVTVAAGKAVDSQLKLQRTTSMKGEGYFGGDPHLHFQRATDDDDQTIFDLLDAEDIQYGTPLGYNEPAGPYTGVMEKMDYPQFRGLGADSIRTRGSVEMLSGQEYRSSQYGHLNLYLRDRLVFPGESFNADDWPVYGQIGAETQSQGGIAIYAHGGYALEIYADAALGTVNGVELLQFGVYRGIGLTDWYHMLNSGYRFPCVGASDYPACRFLGDCRTYVWADPSSDSDKKTLPLRPEFPDWLRGATQGRSFVTTGPLVLFEVAGKRPGEVIPSEDVAAAKVTAKVRVRCEVTPVTTIDLIVNGEVVKSLAVPATRKPAPDEWLTLTHELELPESSWIAARAYSATPGGQPDAESHTNPVYVDRNGKKPYRQASLDAWVRQIDKQIEHHTQRKFAEKAKVLDYFQQARDLLMKIRAQGGLKSDEEPAQFTADTTSGDVPVDPQRAAEIGRPNMTEDELKEFLRPVPPQPPTEAVKSFEGVNGFHMQLVAAEPLVYDPIAAAFDEDGNLYVCEMRDYPYKPIDGQEPIGTVRLLRDTDGDGRFDEAHVFADKLLWAAGVVPWKGGIFVAACPDIWYLKDTDGDHRADIRRRVFTGFGTGNQQAMVNNLQFGLDHWIYGSTAGNGGTVRPGDDPDARPLALTGRDFRFHPETLQIEPVTGTIQFGNTFDDWGHRFVCSESQPLLQVVLPDHYLARNPFLPSPYGIQNIAPGPVPIFRISPIERWRQIRSSRRITKNERAANSAGASHHVVDAAAGATVYRGGAYPPEYYGQVFVGDGQNNLIHRRALVDDGVVFKSQRVDDGTEFMRSPDIWFRPVNFVNAPDGTLYCLDMSREVLESIHIPLDVVQHLDLKSGRDNGRIYRIAPPGFKSPTPPRLSQATSNKLVAALTSRHAWWRETAQRLLYERQDKSVVPQLKKLAVAGEQPVARLGALWTLEGLHALDEATLATAFTHSEPGLRENALRLAEPQLKTSPHLVELACRLADDEHPRVRFQAAFSLGESNDPRAVAALARIARRDGGDPWIRTAVLSSVSESASRLFLELARDPAESNPAVASMLGQLAQVIGVRHRPAEVAQTLDGIAERIAAPGHRAAPQAGSQLLLDLGAGLKRSGQTLKSDQGDSPGARLVRESLQRAEQTLADSQAAPELRAAAMQLLSCAPDAAHRELLAGLLAPDQPEVIQQAAVRALSDDPNPAVAALLLARWQSFVPTVRQTALAALLARDDRTLALLEAAARDEASVADVEPTRRELLLTHKREPIRRLARELFGSAATRTRQSVVAEYQPALKQRGDFAAGRAVFEKSCAACHQVAGKGYTIGPNLASSASREPAALLGHILDPNQYVLPNYLQYVVVDKNGRTYTGLLAAQTATSITLKKEKDETVTVLRGDIDELVSSRKSLMPEGLEKDIPVQAMADLLIFLAETAAQAPGDPNAERDFGTLPGLIEPSK